MRCEYSNNKLSCQRAVNAMLGALVDKGFFVTKKDAWSYARELRHKIIKNKRYRAFR